jgi:YbgC/YbaW family acyl-CoA thioester hydrolase
MTTTSFRFRERLRVRWAEIDGRGVVFSAHYLMYLDTAAMGYWRALALPYAQTLEYLGGELVVRKATLEYDDAARLDDLLDVAIRCARIDGSSITFEAAVLRGEQRLAAGALVYAFTDPRTRAPRAVPQRLHDSLLAFEAGEPMVEVRVGSWETLGRHAQAIRTAVFIEEQKIPAEMEWDDADAHCIHAVAFNRLGLPLATGRLLEHVPGVAKIGRMAVLQTMRGGRIGRHVLDALMSAARSRGDREVVLHAQLSAAAFYTRAGFVERGPVFEEAGIPHVEMVRGL